MIAFQVQTASGPLAPCLEVWPEWDAPSHEYNQDTIVYIWEPDFYWVSPKVGCA